VFYDKFTETGGIPFTPISGDQFMPRNCIPAIKESDFKTDVRLLIGHSAMEGVSFARDFDDMIGLEGRYNPKQLSRVTRSQVYDDIKLFISKTVDLNGKIAGAYTDPFGADGTDQSRQLIQAAAHAYGDYVITCPTILFGAELVRQKAFKGTVYQYRLTYANSQSISYDSYWAEAEHTDEQPLVFGRPLNEPENTWTQTDRKISQLFVDIWTDFAKNGLIFRKFCLIIDLIKAFMYVLVNHRLMAQIGLNIEWNPMGIRTYRMWS
jgi:hypothetical protein